MEERESKLADSGFDIPNFFRNYNAFKIKGNYEFYAQEFAYSAIYGNLKQANIPKILELLNLKRVPRIFFLVRVDELQDFYKTFPEYKVYPLKVNVVNQLQIALQEKNISGVVASFIGRDTIGAFLCLEAETIKDNIIREELSELAAYLINSVKKHTGQNISISISEFCNTLNRFPKAYFECQEAFRKNFRLGEGSYTFFGDEEKVQISLKEADLELFTSQLIFDLVTMDNSGYKKTIEEIIGYLRSTDTSSVDIRLHMVKVVNHIADYYLQLGLEEKTIDLLNLNAMKDILNSNYLSYIEKALQYFCNDILKQIILMNQSPDDKIRVFCGELLKQFYNDSEFNLAKAASICHYSSYHFGRLFKQIFGIPFNQYLTDFRIEKSKELLNQSQLSVEEIAWKVGFSSVSYFCTVFKKITGVSPRQFQCEDKLED